MNSYIRWIVAEEAGYFHKLELCFVAPGVKELMHEIVAQHVEASIAVAA